VLKSDRRFDRKCSSSKCLHFFALRHGGQNSWHR